MQVSSHWSEVVPQTVEHSLLTRNVETQTVRFLCGLSAPAELWSALKCEVLPHCIWGCFLTCPFTPLSVNSKATVYSASVYKGKDQMQ